MSVVTFLSALVIDCFQFLMRSREHERISKSRFKEVYSAVGALKIKKANNTIHLSLCSLMKFLIAGNNLTFFSALS